MTENRFFSWISRIFSWLLNCYDNSMIEKGIAGFCGFFAKRAKKSVILSFFRERYMDGRWSETSAAVKALTAPMRGIRSRYRKTQTQTEKRKTESLILSLIRNAARVPLCEYGILILAFAAGSAVGLIFPAARSAINLTVIFALLLFGAVLYLIKMPLLAFGESSKIVGLVHKTIFYYDAIPAYDHKVCHLSGLRMFAGVMLALGAAGGLIGTTLMTGVLLAALFVFMILWKTEVGVFLFVPLSGILPTMASVGLVGVTIVSFFLHLRFSAKTEYRRTPFFLWIAGFLAAACCAAITSVTLVSSLKILMVYVVFTLSFMVIVNTVKTRGQWTALLILLVFASVLVSGYGVWQNFFLQDTTSSWVDASMFEDIKTRVYATLDNPNVLGQYFILMIPLAFTLLIKTKSAGQKLLYLAGNAVMFACLMYTWSRGAWVGVVLGIGFFLILKDRRWLALCVAGLLLMPSVLPASVLSRLTSIGNVKDSSTAYRVSVWIGSIRLIREYWFSGIGLGSDAFLRVYPHYALGGADFALHSHNFYLQWIVDMGIFGLFLYAGIIATCFTEIYRVREKNTLIRNASLAMGGAMIGYLFQGVAENLWYNYRMILIFWIYMALLESAVWISEKKGEV